MEPKILLIDDSAILRRIAVNVLSTRGVCGEVITATRATEGFARACASGVGLILMDCQIAGMPDADLCRRLLAEPRTSRVPVILLLGPGMSVPPKETLPANIVDLLVKPFTPEQLVGAVKAALGARNGDAPVSRLRESATSAANGSSATARDRHEVAAVVNATVLVRRETNRLLDAQASSKREAPASSGGRAPVDLTALRTAFNDAAQRQETGAFRICAGNGACTEVFLENGQIVVVATKDSERYGEEADSVIPPKVSQTVLETAILEQAGTGIPFFLTLGVRGLLSKTVATNLLHRFGQRHFARLLALPPSSLSLDFVGSDALPGFALRLEPRQESVDEWMLGASRHLRAEDIAAVVRQEGFAGTPTFKDGGMTLMRTLRLNEQERDFCQQVGARRNLAALAKGVGITTEHAYLFLYRLRVLGILDYRSTASAFVVTPRTNVRRVLPLHR